MMRRLSFAILFTAGMLSAQVTFDRLLNAAKEPQNWLTYSGNMMSQRYSPLDQVTPQNVKNLELKWVFQARSLEKFEATPLVVDGIMYTVQAPNDVVALDPVSGRVFWTYSYSPSPLSRPCCGRVNRGVAVVGETLFMGTIDAHLIAIDAKNGRNLFTPESEGVLSRLGQMFVAGLLKHAAPCTAFTTPTINGYRRFRANSLAPDRATWCYDHRGVMIRALGGHGDPATRLENRVGEPAANPYLFIVSQIVAGLDGVDNKLDPGPQNDEPYASDRPLLPKSLPAALDALEHEPLFREALGGVFLDYFLKLKRNECGRFARWLEEAGVKDLGEETTEWEQREYFDFF